MKSFELRGSFVRSKHKGLYNLVSKDLSKSIWIDGDRYLPNKMLDSIDLFNECQGKDPDVFVSEKAQLSALKCTKHEWVVGCISAMTKTDATVEFHFPTKIKPGDSHSMEMKLKVLRKSRGLNAIAKLYKLCKKVCKG